MNKILTNEKFKNPIFWLSLVAILFASAGIDFQTLTSWDLFMDALIGIVQNPVAIISTLIALVGVFNDNGTPGLDKLR